MCPLLLGCSLGKTFRQKYIKFLLQFFFMPVSFLCTSKNRREKKKTSVLEANPRCLHVFSYLIKAVDIVLCSVHQSVK